MTPAVRPTRADQRGQALPLALGVAFMVLMGSFAVFTLGRAHLSGAQAQTAADLTAISAGRELRAALPSLVALSPSAGAPVLRARLAAVASTVAAGAGARVEALRVAGPAWPPTAVEVTVTRPAPHGAVARATARAGLAAPALGLATGPVSRASGGGYAGPLVVRDGKPVCPAVAAAFDLMDAAARGAGHDLVVVSGFRSDAEQAVLFARHPDPRWVARPGHSRHRDATELDLALGPGVHAWLVAQAGRFGFVRRYSWEPWHWGYAPGCGGGAAPGPGAAGAAAAADVPSWVPEPYRVGVAEAARASGVPPALLAALLRAESGFDPRAVSPAGAQGIAQFMPATARGVGLADPFDPAQAIPASARLLAGHLREFGTVPLALAAYNAGAGAVRRHGGIPPYRETEAYVVRILALAGGDAPALGVPGAVVLLRAGDRLV